MTDVDDDKWNEFRMVTDERIGEVLKQSDNGEDIEYTREDINDVLEIVDFAVSFGERQPDNRDKAKDMIKHAVKLIGISYNRRLVFPPIVQEALDELEHRYTITMQNQAETMVTYNIPMFRRQNHNSIEMCWLDEEQYVNNQVKVMITKVKNLYNTGQWDGTFPGLSDILTVNQSPYNQGDEE